VTDAGLLAAVKEIEHAAIRLIWIYGLANSLPWIIEHAVMFYTQLKRKQPPAVVVNLENLPESDADRGPYQ